MSGFSAAMKQREAVLLSELENFEEIAGYFKPSPGDIPEIPGIDVYGEVLPLNGVIGGDHIIYVDFNKRYDLDARIEHAVAAGRAQVVERLQECKRRAGIVLADVSGHRITDGLLAVSLHQAFLLGTFYELDFYGEITTRLFENLNTRFYKSSSVKKFLTLAYGEIWENGRFRFISAAHPIPLVFSKRFNRLVDISPESLVTFPPIGAMPSLESIDREMEETVLGFKERYEVNEITLIGEGDIMILSSDGLLEHSRGEEDYAPFHLEEKLREVKHLTAREIFGEVRQDMLKFSTVRDDISYVVIKKL